MTNHKHKYAKLNDEAVFCEGCGDIKTVQRYAPVYPYPYWWWQPSPTYYPWIVTSDTVTTGRVDLSGTTTFDPNATYTLTSGVI